MWKCSFAAVPGISHNREDYSSCQDVVQGVSEDLFSCICLSDGAGSAKHARLGATEVVNTTINFLKSQFTNLFELQESEIAKRIIENCVLSITTKYGDVEGFSLSDYNATLLVVATFDDKCICAHVGDGVIGVKRENALDIVSFPWNGEYKNVTVFVTSENAVDTIDVKKFTLTKESGFFVMSDGTQTSFYSSKDEKLISIKGLTQILEFAIDNNPEDTNELLDYNLYNLISKNTTDDCSFALMVKVEN